MHAIQQGACHAARDETGRKGTIARQHKRLLVRNAIL
jgi:hypothetical protein